MNNTIILSELSKTIAELTQCTEADAETFVRELFLLAAEKLEADDAVTIPGIGTFKIGQDDIAFAPDADIAATLNAPFSAFEPIELPADYVDDPMERSMEQSLPASEPEPKEEEPMEQRLPASEPEPTPEPIEEPIPEPTPEPAPQEAIHSEVRSLRSIWWILACLLCFAGGWIARGFYHPQTVEQAFLPATSPAPESATEFEDEDASASTVEPEAESGGEGASAPSIEPEPEVVYDTITASRYLTTMARAHYGQMEYWVYIYEENADKLGHPDRLDAGTTVVIPPAEKYGLKPHDDAKIKEAMNLAREIYGRFN